MDFYGILFENSKFESNNTQKPPPFRYGEKFNLKFAMPKSGNRFNYPHYIYKHNVRYEDEYNIICNHLRFQKGILDYLFFSKNVDNSDLLKISIVREPASLFESTFGYLKSNTQAFKRADQDLSKFLQNPQKFYAANEGGQFYMFGHNHMMYDFGFDPEIEDETEILKAIKIINFNFDLVMITEYFEESMVLLKHLLCLHTGVANSQKLGYKAYYDVAYLIANARSEDNKVSLSAAQKQQVYDWNRADTLLYQYMNQTFWGHVKNFGLQKMEAEKILLNQAIYEIQRQCFEGESDDVAYW